MGPVIAELWHTQHFRGHYHAHGHGRHAPTGKWRWWCTCKGKYGWNWLHLKVKWSRRCSTGKVCWLTRSEEVQYEPPLPGRMFRNEYKLLGSTSIPGGLYTALCSEPLSWLISVGRTTNKATRLSWSTIGLGVVIPHAAGVRHTSRPAVMSGR